MKINNAIPKLNNTANMAKAPAFSGLTKYITDDLVKLNRAARGTMTRDLFVLSAFAFLLGTRLITSRDKDEKREVMIRDVPSIVIAVMGVPFVEKIIAKSIQKKTGFALMKEGEHSIYQKIFKDTKNKNVKPPKDIMGYRTLEDFYVFNKDLHQGFDGFSERLDKFGGNLKKIYSAIGDDFKNELSKFKSTNNSEFIEELHKSENTNLLNNIKEAMAKDKIKDNNALRQASALKTYGKIASFAAILATIGIFIPKLNIYITEAIHKNRKKHEKAENSNMVNNK